MKKKLTKGEFIEQFISKKMENNDLDFDGVEYRILFSEAEEEAEYAWDDQCGCSDPGCPCDGFKKGTL